MATEYTKQWILFFIGCGIPEDVAASYAMIFNKNRIQKNMLLDLNKEYLRDMGITVMGDIIAILRHAKDIHNEFIREQMLSEPVDELTVDTINDGIVIKKKTPMKRILEHYTRKYDSPDLSVPLNSVQMCIKNENNTTNVTKSASQGIHCIGIQYPMVKKIEHLRSKELLAGKLEVPVLKSRRVSPENEGSYRIKMPSGTTERSQKILEKAKLKQNKTVFHRLGESSVSSTSDVVTAPGTTGQQETTSGNKEKREKNTSVFSRLGGKSPLVTSTSSNEGSTDKSDELPYKGILKANIAKKSFHLLPSSTLRADNESNVAKSCIYNNNTKTDKLNLVKKRLGTSAINKSSLDNNLNRLQITTTFEEGKDPPLRSQTLSKRFKSLPKDVNGEKKTVVDEPMGFRSGALPKKPIVTSTTELSEVKRGVKRRLREHMKVEVDTPGLSQSKKVRFGQTTQRLIPGNSGASVEKKEINLLNRKLGDVAILTSGVRIGPFNGDGQKLKMNMRRRLNDGSVLQRDRRFALPSTKKKPLNIHDRLG